MARYVPVRGPNGEIREMVPEGDAVLLALLEIDEEEHVHDQPVQPAVPQPVAAPAPAKPRSLAELLPVDPEQPTPAAQPAPDPLSPRANVETLMTALFVIVVLIGAAQFLQSRTPAAGSEVQPTATLAVVNDAAQPTTTTPTVLAYAAPDGAVIGPVLLSGQPAPIGRYGTSNWLYFEFAPPIGAIWLRADDLGMEVSPALKDMKPAPYSPPPVAPAWTEPVAEEGAPAEAAPVERPDLHQQPTVDIPPTPVPPRHFRDEIAAAALDPAGEAENAVKKIINPGNGCLKNKATGETICS